MYDVVFSADLRHPHHQERDEEPDAPAGGPGHVPLYGGHEVHGVLHTVVP